MLFDRLLRGLVLFGGLVMTTALSSGPQPVQESSPDDLDPRLAEIYQHLNLRSFTSSLGPQLKFYCESFLPEYFPPDTMRVDSPQQFTLTRDDSTWVVTLLAPDRIRITDMINGAGYQRTTRELAVPDDAAGDDIRVGAAWIFQRDDCKRLNPGTRTKKGLLPGPEHYEPMQWWCATSVERDAYTREIDNWHRAEPPPNRPQNSGAHRWDDTNLLLMQFSDPTTPPLHCEPGEQLRGVQIIPFRSRREADDPIKGEFVLMVSQQTWGLPSVQGYLRPLPGKRGKQIRAWFDSHDGETPSLVHYRGTGNWISPAVGPEIAAWFTTSEFDENTWTVRSWTPRERIMAATTLRTRDGQPLPVYANRSETAPVIATIDSRRIRLFPQQMLGEWLRVTFEPDLHKHDDESICGAEPGSLQGVDGWIKWRHNYTWLVDEEHALDCRDPFSH